jgi:hypothetical protein
VDIVVEGDEVFFFLAGNTADLAHRAQGTHEGVVGHNIELLLCFALDVFTAHSPENIGKACFIDFAIDHLGGKADRSEQLG